MGRYRQPLRLRAGRETSMAGIEPGRGDYPVRTCLGCGTKLKKTELVRLVALDRVLIADGKGLLPGRGAYCCRNARCYLRLMKQRKKLAWALRCQEEGAMGPLVVSQGLSAEFGILG